MWVEGGDIHDELLDQLGGVLAPPEELALAPSAADLEALAAAVVARWPGGATAPTGIGSGDAVVAESAPVLDPSGAETVGEVRRLRWASPRARRLRSSAWRAGSVAAGIVVFSASAAAASGGVPLPRPVRVVAYTVGLPVDSPALDDTHQHIKELKEAVKAKDTPKAGATVRRLQTDLAKVPSDEKKEAKPKIEAAIAAAVTQIPSLAPTTTTTTAPPATSTTATVPASSTTATTAEEQEKEKERSTVTTTTAPSTTTTTAPESTTTTTAPETDGTAPGGTTGDPGTGDGHTGAGGGGDPGTTPTTVPEETTTTTTTTAPPPEETTTTTTTAPEPVTITTTTQPATTP